MNLNPDSSNVSDNENDVQYIMSLSWDKGLLGAVYYNLSSLELFVMHETVDLRPDYPLLSNLLRQVCPSYLLICGPLRFVQDMLQFLKIPEGSDLNQYKIGKNDFKTTSNIVIFPHDQKKVNSLRHRAVKINLPGLPDNATDSERQFFLESVLPLNETHVVQSLGNLLIYMDHNWQHTYLVGEDNPIVTNLNVFHMESQLLIDESTFYALQIFSSPFHPSGFKQGTSDETVSIFKMFCEKCVSTIGVRELQLILQQPMRDVLELNLRHATIDWCAQKDHQQFVVDARKLLKNVLNPTSIFNRIVKLCGEKASDFKSLIKSIYNVCQLCTLCSKFDSTRNTFMYDLGNVAGDSDTLKMLLFAIDRVVDLEEGEKENRFVVKTGLKPALDAKKQQLQKIQNSLYEADEFDKSLTNRTANEFTVVFRPEMGFVIGIEMRPEDPDPKSYETDRIHVVLQNEDMVFYRTPFCDALNAKFGDLYAEICQHERKICRRLTKYINEAMPELVSITNLCAKLDCMIAFTLVAVKYDFVRPKLTTEKCLYIKKGRHVLVEMKNQFISNDTHIDLVEHKNLINILSAPNAAGKSVYLKQVALICYLAHIGSFVPAAEARIGVLDAIYSRIYCPESVHKDASSFMTDLQQMSRVIMNSTTNSLILIDEFGKGTNLVEGRVLFAACLENIIERGDEAPITIVSTHYPEIYNLLNCRTNVCLKTIKVERSDDGALQSLYQVVDGCNRGSYASEYKEAKRIIDEILMKNPNLQQRSICSVYYSYQAAIKTFVLILLKIYLRDKHVDFQDAYNLYSKAIADIFT